MKKIFLVFSFIIMSLFIISCNQKQVSYKVVIDRMNNSEVETKYVNEKNKVIIEEPQFEGHIFKGWYTEKEYINLFDIEQNEIYKDLNLYAKWDKKSSTYIITYDSNQGSILQPVTVLSHSNIFDYATVVPIKEGYIFKGWFKDENLSNQVNKDDLVTNNITLYAKWEVVKSYVVIKFETYSDTVISELNLEKNKLIPKPIDPQRAGNYEFNGWYLDAQFEKPWNFLEDVAENNLILYAQWLNKYSVTFNTQFEFTIEPQLITSGNIAIEPLNVKKEGYIFKGWSINKDELIPFDFSQPINKNTMLYAIWETGDAIKISTKEQLLEIFINGSSGNFELSNDIDFKNEVFNVPNTTREFSGILDGKGFSLKNINAKSSSNKQGVFAKILKGIIKNLMIENSNYEALGEASGFIAAHIHGGAIVENVEFFNVSISNTGDYTALIAGDDVNNSKVNEPITISNIIVRNFGDKLITSNKSASFILGYIRTAGTIINVNNIYIEGSIKTIAENSAFIISRINAQSTVNIKNFVGKGNLTSTKQVGSVVGQSSSNTTIDMENIYIDNTVFTTNESTVNSFIGNNQGTLKYTNTYFNQNAIFRRTSGDGFISVDANQGLSIQSSNVTNQWFKDNNFSDLFKLENNTLKLNKEIIEEPVDLYINTQMLKPFYLIGESINLEDIIAELIYSTGKKEVVDVNISPLVIDTSKVGKHIIELSYEEFTKTIEIEVVEINEIIIYETNFIDLYFIGEELNHQGIYVYAKLSSKELINLDKQLLTLDTNFNKNMSGNYYINFSYENFVTQSLEITVVNQKMNDDKEIKVYVDKENQNSIDYLEPKFSSIRKALLFIKKSNLSHETLKYIYISDGIYYEKLEIDTPNLIIIGESRLNTVITYDKASGDFTPQGGTFGTQGSASVAVKAAAKGIIMYNLSIKNEFNYFESKLNDKQGVALVNEADQAIYYQVNFYGVQDTLYAKMGRQWYYEVYIEGAVDYIFGNAGPVYIEKSVIHTITRDSNNSYITAYKGFNGNSASDGLIEYGVLFYNNTLTASSEHTIYFGRPWAQTSTVAFINNKINANIHPNGWTDMSGNIPENAYFYEYQNKDKNNQIINTSLKGKELTEDKANKWIDKNIFFSPTNGTITFTDSFNYLERFELIDFK